MQYGSDQKATKSWGELKTVEKEPINLNGQHAWRTTPAFYYKACQTMTNMLITAQGHTKWFDNLQSTLPTSHTEAYINIVGNIWKNWLYVDSQLQEAQKRQQQIREGIKDEVIPETSQYFPFPFLPSNKDGGTPCREMREKGNIVVPSLPEDRGSQLDWWINRDRCMHTGGWEG